jgi:hypothetical protein
MRKKRFPQRQHQQGRKSHWKAISIAFRASALLKSMDLQFGQCVEKSAK